ncbi:Transmembrane protein [Parelaphostrongylus tenuis]|uniref:Transmembrane protein n=1 Tax=Parelaphostrongylus tenuis TaxID=148309 RepID=A0AAD5M2M1_PARTN|nr:Transmembrane protein [Parelaphostrongylus tenuis]
MKGRSARMSDPVRDGIATPIIYVRLLFLWIGVISLDILCGFRFELLYPFWLILRKGYEAVHKNHNAVVTLANHNTAKFSVLFVCVTATSDLICYLFIPVKFLVFLASTYVWVHVIWHSHGGFLRTLSAMIYEKQCFSALIFWVFIVAFEAGIRLKCIHLEIVGSDVPFLHYLCPSCLQTQGLAPVIPRSLNLFFGAHCIGYPLVIVSFSLRYYFKEWRIRRKQDDVCRQNELMARILTEALPAVYEGPKDYTAKNALLEDESDLLELTSGTGQAMLMPPPPPSSSASNGTIHHVNSTAKRTSGKVAPLSSGRHRGSGRPKATAAITATQSHHSTSLAKSSGTVSPTIVAGDKRREREEDEGSEASLCWRDSDVTSSSGGLSVVRLAWEAFVWLTAVVWPSTGDDVRDDSSYGGDDDDDDSIPEENTKKLSRSINGDVTKQMRTSVTPTTTCNSAHRKSSGRSSRESGKAKEKVIVSNVVERDKSNGLAILNGKATIGTTYEVVRDSSLLKESVQDPNSISPLEAEKLRAEVMQLKTAEADARIQLSVSQNNEKHAKQEAVQLRSRLEQMEARYITMEKLRDIDRSSLSQLEKKYAELMNRKNDVERELMDERKARKEDGGKRMDTVEQQREKERQLEQEVDRLRSEALSREERLNDVEKELYALRKYKEMNDIEALNMDLRIMREKMVHLEESLAAENKLKQELFRALGDAKANNAHLQSQLRALENSSGMPLSVSVARSSSTSLAPSEKMSPQQQQQQPQHNMSAYQQLSISQSQKMEPKHVDYQCFVASHGSCLRKSLHCATAAPFVSYWGTRAIRAVISWKYDLVKSVVCVITTRDSRFSYGEIRCTS